jgi:hypothetical protein
MNSIGSSPALRLHRLRQIELLNWGDIRLNHLDVLIMPLEMPTFWQNLIWQRAQNPIQTQIQNPKSNLKSQIESHILNENTKLEPEELKSHLPPLWLALTLHKLAAKVAIQVGRCDQPLQHGRGTRAIRAPGHGHRPILRPFRRDDVAELDIDGRRCRASSLEKEKKKRVGMAAASWEVSGVGSIRWIFSTTEWDPRHEVEKRWIPRTQDNGPRAEVDAL